MEYPYMPVGKINHEGQKSKIIEHAIKLLMDYQNDDKIKQATDILKSVK